MNEKSEYYLQRKKCLCKLIVPTISEVKERWGKTFSDVFFETCPERLKPEVGLTPPLSGAGDELWTSPSDLLIGKVCLKPPMTTRCMKALTHQGIMEIGRTIEQKYWNEMETERLRALQEQMKLLNFVCEHEKGIAVLEARFEEQEICTKEKVRIAKEFEEELERELDYLEEKMLQERDRLLKEQEEDLTLIWQHKLEMAVKETTDRLTAEFLAKMQEKEKFLTKKFEVESKKQEMQMRKNIEQEREICHHTFRELKHNLECRNLSNLMYVLSIERRKCDAEHDAALSELHKQIATLEKIVEEKEAIIKQKEDENDEKQRQINIREECLLEITRQFQKFIYFSLRECPTQAEFLLSVEKLMLFELTKALMQPQCLANAKLAKRIFCWKKSSSELLKSTSSQLAPKDAHRCLSELTPPLSDRSSLRSDEDLPAIYYKNKMYVREDFRNMLSQGIELSPSNELWSKDAQNVMDTLRETDSEISSDDIRLDDGARSLSIKHAEERKSHKGTDEGRGTLLKNFEDSGVYNRRRSSVRFKHRISQQYDPNQGYLPFFNTAQPIDSGIFYGAGFSSRKTSFSGFPSDKASFSGYTSKKTSVSGYSAISGSIQGARRSTLKYRDNVPNLVNYSLVGQEEHRRTLISARNSLELLKDLPSSTLTTYDDDAKKLVRVPETTGILGVRDSLHKHRMSLKIPDTNEVEMSGTLSKQSMTKDSVGTMRDVIPTVVNQPTTERPSRSSLKPPKEKIPELLQLGPISPRPSVRSRKVSKLSMARDSAELLRSLKNSIKGVESKTSKLSTARDSVEIHSESLQRLKEQKQSTEILDGGLLNQGAATTPISPQSTAVDNDEESRVVKISHIEIVKIDDDLNVSFDNKPAMYDVSSLQSVEPPVQIYSEELPMTKEETARDNFLLKPNVAQIEGDRKGKEHLQRSAEFTLHRADSFIGLIKNKPDLIRIFTSCTK